MEYNSENPNEAFELICKNLDIPAYVRSFSKKLLTGICENREEIDRLIKQSSKNWRLERMSRVDRNILRISTFEIIFLDEIPRKVSINEAVELAKRYGTAESGAFINGVLDNIQQADRYEKPSAEDSENIRNGHGK